MQTTLPSRNRSALAVKLLLLGFFLLLGLFITPSGNKGTVLRTRDQTLIALLLVVFGLAAWGVMALAGVMQSLRPRSMANFRQGHGGRARQRPAQQPE